MVRERDHLACQVRLSLGGSLPPVPFDIRRLGMAKELFRIEIITSALIWADSADDAEAVARDREREICLDECELHLESRKAYRIDGTGLISPLLVGHEQEDTLVYHEGEDDISVEECIAKMQARAIDPRQLLLREA